jgi:hypothetical protein
MSADFKYANRTVLMKNVICTIPIAPAIDGLRELLKRGQEQARALKRPIVVSLARQIHSDLSPLAFFAAKTKPDCNPDESRGPSTSLIPDQIRNGTDTGNRPAPFRTFWGQPDQDFWTIGQQAAVFAFNGDAVLTR